MMIKSHLSYYFHVIKHHAIYHIWWHIEMNEFSRHYWQQLFILCEILLITGREYFWKLFFIDSGNLIRAVSLQNSVYIVGGRYASTGRLSGSVFKYDAEIDLWRTCDSMKAPRYEIYFYFHVILTLLLFVFIEFILPR